MWVYETHQLSDDPRRVADDIMTVEQANGVELVSTFRGSVNHLQSKGLPAGALNLVYLFGIFRRRGDTHEG